ncbi:MAG: alpha/beta hydrolase [Jatrophihabitans sp.]
MRSDSLALAAGATAVVTATNAVHPVARTGPLSLGAFAFGLPASELPVHTALVQALTQVALARHGALDSTRGRLGAALTVGSWLGLAQAYRSGDRASDQLERALVDALGPRYRERMAAPLRIEPQQDWTTRRLLLPNFAVRRRYRVATNLRYGEHGRRNVLDVWRRADLASDARAPVVVQIHGGGWSSGMKEGQGEPLMAHLAQRGWVCVAPNYRLSPKATWPDHIVDIKRALAWVKTFIAGYGGDPDFVVVTGGSAGGHLAAVAALTPGRKDWQPGFEDVDTSVAAAVPCYGVYDFLNRHGSGRADSNAWLEKTLFKTLATDDRTRWDEASPMSQVNAQAPPFFVLHGTNDTLSPATEARDFVRDLRAVSNQPVVFGELVGAQHAFDTFPSVRAHHMVHAVERFLGVVRAEAALPR